MLSVGHTSTRTFHVYVRLQELLEFVIVSQIIVQLYLIQLVPFIRLIQHYLHKKFLIIKPYGQIKLVKICI